MSSKITKLKCFNCDNLFIQKNKNHKFCSTKCRRDVIYQNIYIINKPCLQCGNFIECGGYKDQKLCSKQCRDIFQTKFLDIPDCIVGAHRSLDKKLGYIRVYCPMHSEANTWGYVYEHRLVTEQMVGRPLFKNEIVHHKNGKRWDNRPENLEVMDKYEHGKLKGQRKEDLKI